MRKLAAILAATLAVPAVAQSGATVSSAVFVETVADSPLAPNRSLATASQLRQGDRVVLLVEWQTRDNGPLTITSPVPSGLRFREASSREQLVSVDGGRNWGRIGDLTMRDAYGTRLASPQDVTHLRWTIPASEAVRGRGTLAYSAVVR